MRMMLPSSSVGILEYISVMSNKASCSSGSKGISEMSFISCTEFGTLNALGSGVCVVVLTFLLYLINRSTP